MGDVMQCQRYLPETGRDDIGLTIIPASLWSGVCLDICQTFQKVVGTSTGATE